MGVGGGGGGRRTWEVTNRTKTAERRAARRLERRQLCQPHLCTAVLTLPEPLETCGRQALIPGLTLRRRGRLKEEGEKAVSYNLFLY